MTTMNETETRPAALVTGGSRGLGRAMGLELAGQGWPVVLVAREAGPLDQVVAEIRARGGRAHGIAADVADKDAVTAIVGRAAALVGTIDLLVNNASALGPVPLRLLLDTDCEDLERALQVNLVGPFRLTKAMAGPMVLRGRGTIVNISSDAAVEAYPRWGAYGASKAALESLCRQAAVEGAPGVRVNLLHPGLIDTPLGRLASSLSPLREQVKIPARRQGTAWEIAYGGLYLLSNESSYVTGQSLVVDGGLTTAPRA